MRHLLDTNIIIHVLRGNPMYAHLLEMLLDADHVLASCPITITEIYAGMRPIEEPRTRAFMESLSFLPITPRAAELAGLLKRQWVKKGHNLSLPDATIAAVAIENRCVLVTENVKDFPMPEVSLYDFKVQSA